MVDDFVYVDGVLIEIEKIALAEFIHYPWNRIWPKEQRYDSRITKPKGAHLRGNWKPSMSVVQYAEYPDGLREKLDAHSRSEAIKHRKLKGAPEMVVAIKYKVQNREQANEIFRAIDHKDSTDTAADIMAYIFKDLDLDIKSPALKSPTSSLWLAEYGDSGSSKTVEQRIQMVKKYKEELRILDSLGFDKNVQGKAAINTIIMGVFLKAIKEYGGSALGLAYDYKDRRGSLLEPIFEDLDNMDAIVERHGKAGSKERYLFKKWYALVEALLTR